MALDGKLLAAARKELETLRRNNEQAQWDRQEEVYARLPRVRQIDAELRRQMGRLARMTMAGADLSGLEAENLALQSERASLLAAAGWPADYTDERFACPDCRDTGNLPNGQMCRCLKTRYNAQVTRQLSRLLTGDESFARFELDLYPDVPDESGNNPRECMAIVRDFCRTYAEGFDGTGPDLVFSGGPGLGKTFLSACIARVVAETGYSVAYDSATACLGAFETVRFSQQEAEKAAARATVEQYLSCDLMILDDLGTEMSTSVTQNALYTLINQRRAEGRRTIVSTNLTEDALAQRYTPPIVSRLLGDYRWLHFLGTDIRRLR